MNHKDQETLLEFPCQFPLKIMGEKHPEFEAQILAAAQTHASELSADDIESRLSKAGNYQSVTLTVNAQSKAQLDNLYQTLTAHPLVKVVF